MNNRDVWKLLHLLYQQGERGLPLAVAESAGFKCGPDAVRNLADGDAIVKRVETHFPSQESTGDAAG